MLRKFLIGVSLALLFVACGGANSGESPDAQQPLPDADPLLCGNNTLDPGETCDPPATCPTSCSSTDSCAPEVLQGSANTCTAQCVATPPITTCVHDDGCCPSACTRSHDNDCPASDLPSLIVADATSGVSIWNNADTLMDRAPDATLVGPIGIALALYRNRLLVATEDTSYPVFLYDDAWSLADGATFDDRIEVAAFGGKAITDAQEISADAAGNLWLLTGWEGGSSGDFTLIRVLTGGALMGSAYASSIGFTHAFSQIPAMALDTSGNTLFGGQISGAGLVAWENPTAKTGDFNDPDFVLHQETATWTMAIHGDRLYAGTSDSGASPSFLRIWDNVSSISTATAPAVAMGAASGLDDVWHVFLRDDILVATQFDKVNIYLGASGITQDTLPNVTITDTATGTSRKKAYLDAAGTLYLMVSQGIEIYDNALTTPVLRTTLTIQASKPNDFVVVE